MIASALYTHKVMNFSSSSLFLSRTAEHCVCHSLAPAELINIIRNKLKKLKINIINLLKAPASPGAYTENQIFISRICLQKMQHRRTMGGQSHGNDGDNDQCSWLDQLHNVLQSGNGRADAQTEQRRGTGEFRKIQWRITK